MRSGSGYWLKLLFVLLVLGVVAVISVFMLCVKHPDYSDREQRPLAQFPSVTLKGLVSGSFFRELQEHYDDTVPGRDYYKELGSRLLSAKGLAHDDIILIGPVPGDDEQGDWDDWDDWDDQPDNTPLIETATPAPETGGPATPETATPVQSSIDAATPVLTTAVSASEPLPPTATPAEPTPQITARPTPTPVRTEKPSEPDEAGQLYETKGLLIYKGMGLQLYQGSKKALERYVRCIERIPEKCPGVRVFTMSVPVSSVFYLPDKFSDNRSQQISALRTIQKSFSDRITVIDAYSVLSAHKTEKIYLSTDHHWSYLGAYYAMQEFTLEAGVPFTDLSRYQTKTRSGYLGNFYYYYKMNQLSAYPEVFSYYISPHKGYAYYLRPSDLHRMSDLEGKVYFEELETRYSYCISSYFDEFISVTETDAGTGRNLLIIKDSYGDPCAGLLMGSYDRIVMVDPRHWNPDVSDIYQMIADYEIDDVLSVACIFSHVYTDFAAKYERLLHE